ncbi:hypothetical protein HMPREF9374_3309 [Desmospora sp. 8437]|nr:hypothetical protein HMPREF9374_3309 [Desmospora sp. 8437]
MIPVTRPPAFLRRVLEIGKQNDVNNKSDESVFRFDCSLV